MWLTKFMWIIGLCESSVYVNPQLMRQTLPWQFMQHPSLSDQYTTNLKLFFRHNIFFACYVQHKDRERYICRNYNVAMEVGGNAWGGKLLSPWKIVWTGREQSSPFNCQINQTLNIIFYINMFLVRNAKSSHIQKAASRCPLEFGRQNLIYYWTIASCDRGRLQILNETLRWNFCLMTTLTLMLTLRPSQCFTKQ